jgi:hypothetical protein
MAVDPAAYLVLSGSWSWSFLLVDLGRVLCNEWIQASPDTKQIQTAEESTVAVPVRNCLRRFSLVSILPQSHASTSDLYERGIELYVTLGEVLTIDR